MSISRSAILRLLVAIAACDGEVMTVGSEPAAGTSSSSFDAGQVWTGYVEGYRFASGSDRISIAFTTPTSGTVTLGTPPTGSEVIDPEVGYPASRYAPMNIRPELRHHAERFAFTLREGSREGARLRFNVDVREMLTPWCAAQTTTHASQNAGSTWYSCMPNKAHSRSADTCSLHDTPQDSIPVDCGKLDMCLDGQTCTCDATRCWLAEIEDLLHFDVRVNGAEAHGSSDLGQIHLELQ
ncbi:MAG: hypothetical protein KF764_19090 [Labilithrix sp.]|nr:hypothetical protein [Labilithrix sp.]